jgi:hypothetical protein
MPHWDPSTCERIADLGGIPVPTIYYWHKCWVSNHNWRPWDPTHHGMHNRTFRDQDEDEMVKQIDEEYTQRGRLFTNESFRRMAARTYAGLIDEDADDIPNFNASNGFIWRFKKRHELVSRKAHPKRRPTVSDQEKIQFIQMLSELLKFENNDRILNADETSWKLFPNIISTWAKKGAKTVNLRIQGNQKDCITVMGTVTASLRKLPLVILAKGKSCTVEVTQLGDTGENYTDHSESGWTTEMTFDNYLRWLRRTQFPDREPLWLIVDSFTAHITANSRLIAERLSINLIPIPAGMTDELQPLDRSVFGVLKSIGKRLFRIYVEAQTDDEIVIDKRLATQFLIRAWDSLGQGSLRRGWNIYRGSELEAAVHDAGGMSDDELE